MSLPSGMEGARRHRWGSGGLVLPLDFCAQFPASEDSRRFERSPAVGRPGRKIRLGEEGESSEDVSTRPIGVVEDERTQAVDGRIDSGLRP